MKEYYKYFSLFYLTHLSRVYQLFLNTLLFYAHVFPKKRIYSRKRSCGFARNPPLLNIPFPLITIPGNEALPFNGALFAAFLRL